MWSWKNNWKEWASGWRERSDHGERVRDRLWETLRSRWREWAGDLLQPMLADREVAATSLRHHEPSVRRCAISVLVHHWNVRSGDAGASDIYQVAISDPDEETQITAIRALGTCYDNTDDIVVGRALALIVRDDRRPPLLRTFAYHALFQIRGLRIPWLQGRALAPGEKPRLPQAPADVDWSFVASFLVEGRLPSPENWFEKTVPESDRAFMQCYAEADDAFHLGKYEEAISLFSQAIGLKPTFLRTYYMRARVMIELERCDEAIRDLTVVIESCPDWAEAYGERARAYARKGLADKASADREAAERARRPSS